MSELEKIISDAKEGEKGERDKHIKELSKEEEERLLKFIKEINSHKRADEDK